MCGRYTLRAPDRIRIKGFDASLYLPSLDQLLLEPRYNIAPSQAILTIRQKQDEKELSPLVWGLVPSWSATAKGFINARAETLEARASFSESFHRRRCLIPADGFYEWKKEGKARQPYYFQLQDGEPFAFAGIWDTWRKDGVSINSCAIITTTPNEMLAPIHDRMPAILPPETNDLWLDPRATTGLLAELLAPYPAAAMKGYPVSTDVNHTKLDDKHLVEPIEAGFAVAPTLFDL